MEIAIGSPYPVEDGHWECVVAVTGIYEAHHIPFSAEGHTWILRDSNCSRRAESERQR